MSKFTSAMGNQNSYVSVNYSYQGKNVSFKVPKGTIFGQQKITEDYTIDRNVPEDIHKLITAARSADGNPTKLDMYDIRAIDQNKDNFAQGLFTGKSVSTFTQGKYTDGAAARGVEPSEIRSFSTFVEEKNGEAISSFGVEIPANTTDWNNFESISDE